jgi:pimeloyl-ACP methyl ester carboxylesterase
MAEMAWTARLAILEEAGHVPTLEAPEAVTEAMTALLDRQAPLTLRRSPA